MASVLRFPQWASQKARWRQRGVQIVLAKQARERRFFCLMGELWLKAFRGEL